MAATRLAALSRRALVAAAALLAAPAAEAAVRERPRVSALARVEHITYSVEPGGALAFRVTCQVEAWDFGIQPPALHNPQAVEVVVKPASAEEMRARLVKGLRRRIAADLGADVSDVGVLLL